MNSPHILCKGCSHSLWISLYDSITAPPIQDLKEPLSPEEDIIVEDELIKRGVKLDTVEFVAIEDDKDSTMDDCGRKVFTKGYVPKITTTNIFDIPWANTYISSIKEYNNKMQGLIRTTVIHFKIPPQEDPLYLIKNSKLIATLITYQTGIMMLKCLEQMSRLKIPFAGKYYKITLSIKTSNTSPRRRASHLISQAHRWKMVSLCTIQSQKEELHHYQNGGAPMGIASPAKAFKTAFNVASRSTCKSPSLGSNYTYHSTLSATINMYETTGTKPRGCGNPTHRHYRRKGDRVLSLSCILMLPTSAAFSHLLVFLISSLMFP